MSLFSLVECPAVMTRFTFIVAESRPENLIRRTMGAGESQIRVNARFATLAALPGRHRQCISNHLGRGLRTEPAPGGLRAHQVTSPVSPDTVTIPPLATKLESP